MTDMSKHSHLKQLISGFFAVVFVFVALLQTPTFAQYNSDSYGACAYGEACAVATVDDSSDDLSDTGDNQKILLYGALVLVGIGIVVYTIRRKRQYKLPR